MDTDEFLEDSVSLPRTSIPLKSRAQSPLPCTLRPKSTSLRASLSQDLTAIMCFFFSSLSRGELEDKCPADEECRIGKVGVITLPAFSTPIVADAMAVNTEAAIHTMLGSEELVLPCGNASVVDITPLSLVLSVAWDGGRRK